MSFSPFRLFTALLLLTTVPLHKISGQTEPNSSYYSQGQKIFKTDQPIKIKTQPGTIYVYIEGSDPDLKFGLLKKIARRYPPIDGNGEEIIFSPKSNSPFHMVEMTYAKGTVILSLQGPKLPEKVRYVIERQGVIVMDGVLQAGQIVQPPPLLLPFGNYSMRLIVEGYKVVEPKQFQLAPESNPLLLSFALVEQLFSILVHSDQQEITNGRNVYIQSLEESNLDDPSKEDSKVAYPFDKEILLSSGHYRITYPEVEGFALKEKSITFDLVSDNPQLLELMANYTPLYGKISINFTTQPSDPFLKDQIHFTFAKENTPATPEKALYPRGNKYNDDAATGMRSVDISQLEEGTYDLVFYSAQAPSTETLWTLPPAEKIQIKPGQSIQKNYEIHHRGAFATVTIETNEPHSSYTLVNRITSQRSSGKGESFSFPYMAQGQYEIIFNDLSDSNRLAPAKQIFEISNSEPKLIQGIYRDSVALRITPNLAYYDLHFIDSHSHEVIEFTVDQIEKTIYLPKGNYQVEFYPSTRISDEQRRQLSIPKPIQIDLSHIEKQKVIEIHSVLPKNFSPFPKVKQLPQPEFLSAEEMARRNSGTLLVAYDTGLQKERIERIRFWLVDSEATRHLYPQTPAQIEYRLDNPHIAYLTISDLQPGTYRLEFLLPNQDGLFASTDLIETIDISPGKMVTFRKRFIPQYGDALVKVLYEKDTTLLDSQKKEAVTCTLLDREGNLHFQGKGESFQFATLLPGQYQLHFSQLAGYVTPAPYSFEVGEKQLSHHIEISYDLQRVALTIESQGAQGHWKLKRYQKVLATGTQGKYDFQFPMGSGYTLDAEKVTGYDLKVSPSSNFTLSPDNVIALEIRYQPVYGSIEIDGPLLNEEQITLQLTPRQSHLPEYIYQIKSVAGRLHFSSDQIMAGTYLLSYHVPTYVDAVASKEVKIRRGEKLSLTPEFKIHRSIEITSNLKQARYSLWKNGRQIDEGEGLTNNFNDLEPGDYLIKFSSDEQIGVIPPEDLLVHLTKEKDACYHASYEKRSTLWLSANINGATILLENKANKNYYEFVADKEEKIVYLPEGTYAVQFGSMSSELLERYGDQRPNGYQIQLKAGKVERLHALYKLEKGSIVITTNTEKARFRLIDLMAPNTPVIGTFTGNYVVLPSAAAGSYRIDFDAVAGFTPPESITFKLNPNQRQVLGGLYLSEQKMMEIARGSSIIGDTFGEGQSDELPARVITLSPFHVGIHPVTNAHYTAWLTHQVAKGSIKFSDLGSSAGGVYDLEGKLLCYTMSGNANSQIQAIVGDKTWRFIPLPGKEHHPMILVTWYGADSYCRTNGYRLPTEAEWERAAGVVINPQGKVLRKYRYGTSSDEVDKRQANFFDKFEKRRLFEVHTRPVGFYDGINMIEYSPRLIEKIRQNPDLLGQEYGTLLSQSPSGLFDMSGNVRQWVSDWYDPLYYRNLPELDPTGPAAGKEKVTKGGCYDSVLYELRISARLPLNPGVADPYTGFRVASSD